MKRRHSSAVSSKSSYSVIEILDSDSDDFEILSTGPAVFECSSLVQHVSDSSSYSSVIEIVMSPPHKRVNERMPDPMSEVNAESFSHTSSDSFFDQPPSSPPVVRVNEIPPDVETPMHRPSVPPPAPPPTPASAGEAHEFRYFSSVAVKRGPAIVNPETEISATVHEEPSHVDDERREQEEAAQWAEGDFLQMNRNADPIFVPYWAEERDCLRLNRTMDPIVETNDTWADIGSDLQRILKKEEDHEDGEPVSEFLFRTLP